MPDFPKPGHQIHKMAFSDVPQVVIIHLESFQGFFLSLLGPNFLRQLYTSILEDPSGIAWVYKEASQVIGFVAGTSQPPGFYRRLAERHWQQFALASFGPFLRQPSILPRLLRAFKTPYQDLPRENCGKLLSIAVLPEYQGKGIGEALILAFFDEAKSRGLEQVILTTDRDHNEGVNRFYQALGFTIHRSFITPEGREMNEYQIYLH